MIIRRISKIMKIGKFYQFTSGGGVEYANENRLTVIYGLNSYGKSTLADIFRSLASNNPAILDARASIPNDTSVQRKVEIGYRNLTSTDTRVTLETTWSSNDLSDRVHVFDKAFADRNVMTPLEMSRPNHEALTDFVLGEAGVELSNEIGVLNASIRALRVDLSSSAPPFVAEQSMADIDAFVDLDVTETDEELSQAARDSEAEIGRINDVEALRSLPSSPELLRLASPSLTSLLSESVQALESSYANVTAEVAMRVNAHIQQHMVDDPFALGFLSQGNEYNDGENCPFCGASSQFWDTSLVDAYNAYFDDAFKQHDAFVHIQLDKCSGDMVAFLQQNYRTSIRQITVWVESLTQYAPRLEPTVATLNTLANIIDDHLAAFIFQASQFSQDLTEVIAAKRQAPYRTMDIPPSSFQLTGVTSELDRAIGRFNDLANRTIEEIHTLTSTVTDQSPTELQAAKRQATLRLEDALNRRARLDLDAECQTYKTKRAELVTTEATLAQRSADFEAQQSQYIQDYFGDVDRLFRRLGTGDFTIASTYSMRGNKRVYSLSAKFHGVDIPTADLPIILSESDKRNLALAIFIAKVRKLPESHTRVLVFDDPVVSFDDNRLDITQLEILDLARDFGHVIVLTHYSSLVRAFDRSGVDARYLEITKDNSNFVITTLDLRQMRLEGHQFQHQKLCDLGLSGNCGTYNELRVFLEDHLRIRFQQQIRDLRIDESGLAALIQGLFDNAVVSEDAKNEMFGYIGILNSPSHEHGQTVNPENWNNLRKEMFVLLYGAM